MSRATEVIPSEELHLFRNRKDLERIRSLIRCYFRFFHSVKIYGTENLIDGKPCLIAANHISYYDPLVLSIGFRQPVRYMAWESLFTEGFLGWGMQFTGSFPVDLSGKNPSGFRNALKLLKNGDQIVIFPEGERSMSGQLIEFRAGIARLAMSADVPIIPAVIRGAYEAWPRGDWAPNPWFHIEVEYYPPIYPNKTGSPQEKRAEAERIRTEIKTVIRKGLENPRSKDY